MKEVLSVGDKIFVHSRDKTSNKAVGSVIEITRITQQDVFGDGLGAIITGYITPDYAPMYISSGPHSVSEHEITKLRSISKI